MNHGKTIYYIYMMNSYKNYINLIRNVLKNFAEFDDIIERILLKNF